MPVREWVVSRTTGTITINQQWNWDLVCELLPQTALPAALSSLVPLRAIQYGYPL